MKILIKGKVETVSLDRVKPAYFECEPATGILQHSVKRNRKRRIQRLLRSFEGLIRTQNRSSSILTQNSDRTRVQSKTNTQTQSAAAKIGKNLATQTQPKQFTPYVAPHSRTPDVFLAKGSDGGLRTYSRVPLHFRSETPHTTDKPKTSNVRNTSDIADSDKIISDDNLKQTRVG